MNYIESERLDLKAKYADTIVRDMVAFLNADGGDIVIGVDDKGIVVGVNNIDETSKKISDIITTQIEPNPQEIIETKLVYEGDKTLLVVQVQKGILPLYCI